MATVDISSQTMALVREYRAAKPKYGESVSTAAERLIKVGYEREEALRRDREKRAEKEGGTKKKRGKKSASAEKTTKKAAKKIGKKTTKKVGAKAAAPKKGTKKLFDIKKKKPVEPDLDLDESGEE